MHAALTISLCLVSSPSYVTFLLKWMQLLEITLHSEISHLFGATSLERQIERFPSSDSAKGDRMSIVHPRTRLEQIRPSYLFLNTNPDSSLKVIYISPLPAILLLRMATPRANFSSCRQDLDFYAFDTFLRYCTSCLSAFLERWLTGRKRVRSLCEMRE